MAFQAIFRRYELKYILSLDQKIRILEAMDPYMELDQYGRTTIRNIYFDTDSFRLVRNSIEKPVYKEKLRIRSYTQADSTSPIFVELKKKYQSVVYKRRLKMPQNVAISWLSGEIPLNRTDQIAKEIEYFKTFYGSLKPKVFLSYEREAYYCREGGDFRITFDDTIQCRQSDLSLAGGTDGFSILEPDKVLMEVKTVNGLPMWMVDILSQEKIYKTSYSKYGTAYQTLIFPRSKGGFFYAGHHV